MDKLTMAHEYFMKHGRNNSWMESDVIDAWKYADAMQAEADKRNNKETCDKNIGLDSSVLKPSNSMELEWQPDWSQAPEWANWWTMDKNKLGIWHNKIPCNKQSTHEWVIDFSLGSDFSYKVSPDFNYQGNWKDSLRKRPQ